MNRSPLQRLHLPPLKIAGSHRGSENTAGSRCCWGFFADQWAHLCWKPSIGRSCRIDRAAVVQPPSATLALLSVAPCSQGRARLPKRRLFLLHCESMAAAWHRLSLKSSVSPAARRRTQGCIQAATVWPADICTSIASAGGPTSPRRWLKSSELVRITQTHTPKQQHVTLFFVF